MEAAQIPARRVLSALTMLQVQGAVEEGPDRRFSAWWSWRNRPLTDARGDAPQLRFDLYFFLIFDFGGYLMAAKTDLVIVESPSKAKTIGKYLGPGYEVKASMGHVRDLPKSKIGVDIEGGFVPQYQPIKGKEDIIKELKTAAREPDRLPRHRPGPRGRGHQLASEASSGPAG